MKSLNRGESVILFLLILFSAVSWALLFFSTGTEMMGAPVFLSLWIVMMVAMMFPTASPMILTFTKVHRNKKQKGQSFVPTWIFVGAYLVVWVAFGAGAYLLSVGAQTLGFWSLWVGENASFFGALILVAAGVYQLSSLKLSCLSKCRSPLDFMFTSWRDGYGGSFRMGIEHGLYCVGCCWLLFLILFPLGIMNIAIMGLVTLLIFAEKSLPIGKQVSRIAAFILIFYGILAAFSPSLLPIMNL